MTSTTPLSANSPAQGPAQTHGQDFPRPHGLTRHPSDATFPHVMRTERSESPQPEFRPWPEFPYGGEDPDFHSSNPAESEESTPSDTDARRTVKEPTPTDRLRILGAGLVRTVREATARAPKE